MTNAFNSSIWDSETGGSETQSNPWLHSNQVRTPTIHTSYKIVEDWVYVRQSKHATTFISFPFFPILYVNMLNNVTEV